MLADKVCQMTNFVSANHVDFVKKVTDDIASYECQRFSISKPILDLALQIVEDFGKKGNAEAIVQFNNSCFLPAEKTWIEFVGLDGNKMGIYLLGKTSAADKEGDAAIKAFVAYFFGVVGNDVIMSNQYYGYDMTTLRIFNPTNADLSTGNSDNIPLIVTLCHLIGTRKITELRQSKLAALNKKRNKHGKPFALKYSEVIITPDAEGAQYGEAKAGTGLRALHHVRTFIRMRRGKLELVRPHWRGDPRNGMVIQRHTVKSIKEVNRDR